MSHSKNHAEIAITLELWYNGVMPGGRHHWSSIRVIRVARCPSSRDTGRLYEKKDEMFDKTREKVKAKIVAPIEEAMALASIALIVAVLAILAAFGAMAMAARRAV
jgi:hypothetical protein